MSATALRLLPLGMVVVLAALVAGCPASPPSLTVTPLALDFGATDLLRTFRISNSGGGAVSWEIEASDTWLSVALSTRAGKAQTLTGSTSTGMDVIEVYVERSALPLGRSNGQIQINSNAGNQVIAVSVQNSAPAQLEVSPDEVDLGIAAVEGTFTVHNSGHDPLSWNASTPQNAPWLSVTPSQGTVDPGASRQVTVRANRALLAGGETTAPVSVTSNGGSATVTVRVMMPPFSVDPLEVDFGFVEGTDSQTLTVTNHRADVQDIALGVSTEDGGDWLEVDTPALSLPAGISTSLVLSATATGLSPGEYLGEVLFSGPDFDLPVPVRMELSGFGVSTATLNFGTVETETSQDFSVRNQLDDPVNYTITVPQTDQAWLSVDPASGSLTGEQPITVTVNPLAVPPGSYSAVLLIAFEGGQRNVTVNMSRPQPPGLRVEPGDINFGGTRTQEIVGIWNDGTGTVDWRIDTQDFPDWLELSPVDGAGIASGTVSGEATDIVNLQVFRDRAPAGVFDLQHQFTVEAAGDSSAPVEVQVRATIPVVPEIVVLGQGQDDTGVQFISFQTTQVEREFVIRNTGTGSLSWNIDLSTAPDFISSVSPQQGTVQPGGQQTVTVRVNRAGLSSAGAQHTLQISSNDPNRSTVPLLVEVQVPKRARIGTQPESLSFGAAISTLSLAVANVGDPDTVLNFRITSTKEWLSVFPDTGSSVGTAGAQKDFREVSVSVDRSLLDEASASARLVIRAFAIEDGQQVPVADVPAVEIEVSADAQALTIESARPRTRTPSQVRNVLLMRNLRSAAIQIPEPQLEDLGTKFQIFEDDVPLELTETEQFLTSGARLRTNIILLLDYSGSMQAAARALEEDGQIAAPDGLPLEDPLQHVYEMVLPPLIAELPEHYNVAIGVFSDRATELRETVRVITEGPGEPVFTRDKDRLLDRLFSIEVRDNGATELLPALEQAARMLVLEDETYLFPFDDADVRGIICVTDGRLTTPPGSIEESLEMLLARHVRLFSVGWGQDVAAAPLIQLSQPSGGHYYPTRTILTGGEDAFGNAIRKPSFAALADWFELDETDPCDQSIANDLKSQVVLSYTTLREDTGASLEGRVTFNDPNDGPIDPLDPDSACLPEQGNITGRFIHPLMDFQSIAGDNRLGQISLEASEISGGEATVTVRLDFVPRNVSRFSFSIVPDANAGTMTVSQVPAGLGGAISNWESTQVGNTHTFSSDTPLKYGEFGDLLRLDFSGVTGSFLLLFEVLDPVYDGSNPESKYFTYPDSIFVEPAYPFLYPPRDVFFEPAIPRPFIGSDIPPTFTNPLVFDLGTGIDELSLELFNLGGSHVSPEPWRSVGLDWEIINVTGTGELTVAPEFGFVTSTLAPDTITVTVDRSLPPDIYLNTITIAYTFGSFQVFVPNQEVQVWYSVQPPALEVEPDTLAFGAATQDLAMTVTNTGQSTLDWSINMDLVPQWLLPRRTTGALGPEQSQEFLVSVNRQGLPPGDYTFTMTISSEAANQQVTIPVSMTVAP